MNLEVVTPEKKLFSGEVKRVQLPGLDGLFEILNNHAPMISALNKGELKITDEGGNDSVIDIESGFMEVLNNNIVVLVEGGAEN